MSLIQSTGGGGNGNGSSGNDSSGDGVGAPQMSTRVRTLEHAMRTPVGTLAASVELLCAMAADPQKLEGAVQTMARQVRLLTSQLEQLHDIGRDLATAEK